MGGIFSSSSPDITPVVAAPTKSDAEVQAAIEKERELARRRKGRASTILTSVSDETLGKSTILGGNQQ